MRIIGERAKSTAEAHALEMAPWLAATVVLVCVMLTFVPMRWAHPMRTPFLWPVTVALSGLWGIAAAVTLWSGFPAGTVSKAILLLAALYGVGLALMRSRAG